MYIWNDGFEMYISYNIKFRLFYILFTEIRYVSFDQGPRLFKHGLDFQNIDYEVCG